MKKHEGATLQEIRKCKNDVIKEFGGSDALEVEIKKQIIFHLSESDEEDEENFKVWIQPNFELFRTITGRSLFNAKTFDEKPFRRARISTSFLY